MAHPILYLVARAVRALDIILIFREDMERVRTQRINDDKPRASQACPPPHNTATD